MWMAQIEPCTPCRHMARWVAAATDDSLRGFARWYTTLHLRGCPRCRAALAALRAVRERLLDLGRTREAAEPLPADRQRSLQDALDAIDRGGGSA
jgi:hypothetical protein